MGLRGRPCLPGQGYGSGDTGQIRSGSKRNQSDCFREVKPLLTHAILQTWKPSSSAALQHMGSNHLQAENAGCMGRKRWLHGPGQAAVQAGRGQEVYILSRVDYMVIQHWKDSHVIDPGEDVHLLGCGLLWWVLHVTERVMSGENKNTTLGSQR